MSPWPTGTCRWLGFAWVVSEARRRACLLAHATLRRWGIQETVSKIVPERVEVPNAGDILERIRREINARLGYARVAREALVLVVGNRTFEFEMVPALNANGFGEFHVGRADYDGVTGRERRSYTVYGVPVVLTPWLADGDFVVLPAKELLEAAELVKNGHVLRREARSY